MVLYHASARATQGRAQKASAEATAAAEDATEKDGPNKRVEKIVETYAEKLKVSAAGVKTAEMSRARVSSSTTLASSTTRTTFQRAAETFVQTKTDLELTHFMESLGH